MSEPLKVKQIVPLNCILFAIIIITTISIIEMYSYLEITGLDN